MLSFGMKNLLNLWLCVKPCRIVVMEERGVCGKPFPTASWFQDQLRFEEWGLHPLLGLISMEKWECAILLSCLNMSCSALILVLMLKCLSVVVIEDLVLFKICPSELTSYGTRYTFHPLSCIRGCSHITSAKIRGSWTPPPPSVSFRQHLPDIHFLLQFFMLTCLHVKMDNFHLLGSNLHVIWLC